MERARIVAVVVPPRRAMRLVVPGASAIPAVSVARVLMASVTPEVVMSAETTMAIPVVSIRRPGKPGEPKNCNDTS